MTSVLCTSEGRRAFCSSLPGTVFWGPLSPPRHLLRTLLESHRNEGSPSSAPLSPALSMKPTRGRSSKCFIGKSPRQRAAPGWWQVSEARPCDEVVPPSPRLAPEGAVAEGHTLQVPLRGPGPGGVHVCGGQGRVACTGPGAASDIGSPVCASRGLGRLTWDGAQAGAS